MAVPYRDIDKRYFLHREDNNTIFDLGEYLTDLSPPRQRTEWGAINVKSQEYPLNFPRSRSGEFILGGMIYNENVDDLYLEDNRDYRLAIIDLESSFTSHIGRFRMQSNSIVEQDGALILTGSGIGTRGGAGLNYFRRGMEFPHRSNRNVVSTQSVPSSNAKYGTIRENQAAYIVMVKRGSVTGVTVRYTDTSAGNRVYSYGITGLTNSNAPGIYVGQLRASGNRRPTAGNAGTWQVVINGNNSAAEICAGILTN